jgi:hypothetical protein
MPNPDPATSTRQRRQRARRLACPKCGSTRLSSVEQLQAAGRCRAITVDATGASRFHWTGWTDAYWDTSTTIGLSCNDCFHDDTDVTLEEIAGRFAPRGSRRRASARGR